MVRRWVIRIRRLPFGTKWEQTWSGSTSFEDAHERYQRQLKQLTSREMQLIGPGGQVIFHHHHRLGCDIFDLSRPQR